MYQLIAMVVIMIISYLLRPKPQAPVTPTPGDVEGTTVDSSSPVPVLFGTRVLSSANCVWYGNIKTTPIRTCS